MSNMYFKLIVTRKLCAPHRSVNPWFSWDCDYVRVCVCVCACFAPFDRGLPYRGAAPAAG